MHEKKPTPLLQKIFDLRKTKKITLAQMGKVLGVSGTTMGNIENGNILLKAEDIYKISKLFNMEPWEIFIEHKQTLKPVSNDEWKLILAYRKVKDED